jgi:hypothetical protein
MASSALAPGDTPGNRWLHEELAMRFVIFLETEVHDWPGPKTAPSEGIAVDVEPETKLDEAAAEAVSRAPRDVRNFYHAGGSSRIFYFPAGIRDMSVQPPELMPFPSALPDATGELVWTAGGHLITIGDLQRAKDEGLFDGDPTGMFLEGPFFGEAPPGWLDLIDWLTTLGPIAVLLIAFVRRRFEKWKNRGAVTPFAFLDLVVARDEWKQEHLARLLGITDQETSDLLGSMGFVQVDARWKTTEDPTASELRRKIIEDYLHRTYRPGPEPESPAE